MKFYSPLLAACLLVSQSLYADSALLLPIESVSKLNAQWFFHNLHAEQANNKVIVRGRVRPGQGVLSTTSGHVDIAIYDADGKLLAETTAEYFSKNVRRAQMNNGAAFEAELNVATPPGSTVKVAFHSKEAVKRQSPAHGGDTLAY